MDVKTILTSLGGVKKGSRFTFPLFSDYRLVFKSDDYSEKMYIYSKRFSEVMGAMFGGDDRPIARNYLASLDALVKWFSPY